MAADVAVDVYLGVVEDTEEMVLVQYFEASLCNGGTTQAANNVELD